MTSGRLNPAAFRGWRRALLVCGAVVLLDQVSKAIVVSSLSVGERVQLILGFTLTNTPNSGLAYRRMPSGAGHDAQNLASVTDSGMLFIPSRGGRSHRPDETSDWKAIERGGNVLLRTLLQLAS